MICRVEDSSLHLNEGSVQAGPVTYSINLALVLGKKFASCVL